MTDAAYWLLQSQSASRAGLSGPLRIEAGAFCDDTGPRLPAFCHFGEAFSAFCRPEKRRRVLQQLDVIAEHYDGIRFWDVLGYYDRSRPDESREWIAWLDREVTPIPFETHSGRHIEATLDYYPQLDAFLAECRTRGLRVHHSRGDQVSWTPAQRRTRIEALAHLVRVGGHQETVALFEVLNEAWQNGITDPTEARALADLFRTLCPGPLVATSSPPSEDPAALEAWRGPDPFFYIHGLRGQFFDVARHIFGLGYDSGWWLGWQGEPIGYRSSVATMEDPEGLTLCAAMALTFGQVWTYMSGHGVFWDGPMVQPLGGGDVIVAATNPVAKAVSYAAQEWDFEQHQPGFVEVARVRDLLPRDVMTYRTRIHGGDAWRAMRIFAADDRCRVEQAIADDGSFVAIPYAEHAGTYAIPIDRPCEAKVYHPVTREVVETIRPGQNTLSLTFERGRIIVGRLA